MTDLLLKILQGAALAASAPALLGVMNYMKARGQGRSRRIAFILQPYRDLLKLFRLPAVRSKNTSWLFAAAPVVVFTAYTWLAFSVPVFARETLVKMDLIVLIYVLGLARFSLSLAGLDSGAGFGGLGSSREMFFHVLTEAGLVLVWAALALHWKTIDLSALLQRHTDPGIFFKYPQLIFPALSFGLLIIMEAGLIPVDNPDTHLELTMSRKAITLEFAGRDLALIEWAEMIKLLFLVTLFSRLFLPFLNPGAWFASGGIAALLLDVAGFFFQAIMAAAIISSWESLQPKMRLRKISSLAWFSMLLSLVMIVYVISSPGAGGVKP